MSSLEGYLLLSALLFSIGLAGALTRRNAILVLISAAHIDDDNSLPDEVPLKALFNCIQGVTDCVCSIVRGHTHKKVHFAYAHQLAKQIIR